MVKLEAGNVLLKPSHRRQLMGWLKRPSRIGQRLGDFDMTIKLLRVGRQHEVIANVRDSAGRFTCRTRQRDWRGAVRELIHHLVSRLHLQKLQQA
ncbi:MAG TPA: hypothetical protein VH475_09820 [Tepidisphaeraceae bacterium]|jgi:hypothetical protein